MRASMSSVDQLPHFKHHIYLIRHGETAWSKSKQHTGRTDIPLTKEGEREALTLPTALKSISFKKVFTSPLQRVVKTCELAGLLDHAELSDDLLEFDYGKYEGMTTEEVCKERPGWNFFKDGVPSGETFELASKRVDHIIKLVSQIDGDVAFFSSGHISRIIGARWLGLPASYAQYLALSTASISVLGYEHSWRVIQKWNETPHLNITR